MGEQAAALERAVQWVAGQRPAMEALLERLCRQNSFTENVPGVNAVADALEAALRERGLAAERVKSARFGDHLRFDNAGAGPAVYLVGHTDTVFPPGAYEGWTRDGDVVSAPGVFDMKGGLVVQLFALGALREAGLFDRLHVKGLWVSDEEVGSPESQPLLREHARGAACALDFESGRAGDLVVVARKGTAAVSVEAAGVAAHAGNEHEKGRNAIWAVARFVDRAQALTDYARGVTVNVGRVEGGTSKNTVPERARCEVDLRFLTVKDGDALFAAIEEAARAAAQSVPGTSLTVKPATRRPPLEQTAASVKLAEEYGACQRACGLGAGLAPLSGGGSDAATTAVAGVPSIDGLGPRGGGFHTTKEWADLASLVPKTQALVRFLAARAPG